MSVHFWEGGCLVLLLVLHFPPKASGLCLPWGERLQLKPHPKRAFSSPIEEKKNNMGEFSRFHPIHNKFEKLICCSCFLTPP